MNLKPGVDMNGVQPEILSACAKIHDVMMATGEFTITACLDGQHMQGSLHYVGRAVDIRTHHMPDDVKLATLAKIKEILGRGYDVILEAKDTPNEHFHAEWDPK